MPISRLIFAATLATTILIAGARASAANLLSKLPIRTIELSNGLHAELVERPGTPVVTVEMWYHVGARNEAPGKTGFAHLFEHLMFDGTTTLGGKHFSDYIVRSGGIDNAYTTDDATVFWETVPSSSLATVLWLEADRMRHLEINRRTFVNERAVVEEESRHRFDNVPYGTVVAEVYRSAFRVHPYQHRPIGSTQDLERAQVEDIRQFYDTWYQPDDATVVIAGGFSMGRAVKWVRQYFGPIPASNSLRRPSIPPEPAQTVERVSELKQDAALPAFVEAFHIPADGSPDCYALRLISQILSMGESGLLYRSLIYKKELAVEAQSDAMFSEDPNLLLIFVVMNSGRRIGEGEAAVARVIEALRSGPPTAGELEKARNQELYGLAESRESSRGLAEALGYDAVVLNSPELINSEAQKLMSVTPEQIQAAARKYLVPKNMTLLEIDSQSSNTVAATSPSSEKRR